MLNFLSPDYFTLFLYLVSTRLQVTGLPASTTTAQAKLTCKLNVLVNVHWR